MENQDKQNKMEKIVSWAKRRGFIFPTCEIYEGFANGYTYGPYGVALKNNVKALWWSKFVDRREDMYGLDGPIILHPRLWEASGHVAGFNDAMIDCKKCQKRFRADHVIEEATGQDLEGDLEKMNEVLSSKKIACPNCGKSDWTPARLFSMMFKTEMNGIDGAVYLRPETAGAIFVEFNNIVDTMRPKLPFGIAQIGKAFRNEIVTGNFIFRLREFEQMEIEYFIDPEADWEKIFDVWLAEQKSFALSLGVKEEQIHQREHPKEKLSHYSRKTVDWEFDFPFGTKELCGLAHRGDFDLKSHAAASGKEMVYRDPFDNKRTLVPQVIEPSFGLERAVLAAIVAAYDEEDLDGDCRLVMRFPARVAPIQIAVFPLLKNKEDLVAKAREVFSALKSKYRVEFDDNGNIGKRYRRQDEIGTPYCVTIDFDSLEKKDVTVRDRDSMKQERVSISELENYLEQKMGK